MTAQLLLQPHDPLYALMVDALGTAAIDTLGAPPIAAWRLCSRWTGI